MSRSQTETGCAHVFYGPDRTRNAAAAVAGQSFAVKHLFHASSSHRAL